MKKTHGRVLETSTTTGTGAYTLAGAVTGYRAFGDACASADTVDYYAEDINAYGQPIGAWETGVGTWVAGNSLLRTAILDSSNAGAPVAWGVGMRRIGHALAAQTLDEMGTRLDAAISPAQAAAAAPVQTVAGKTGNVVLGKADVALDQADNTADIDKRISTLTQAALDAKEPKGTVAAHVALPNPHSQYTTPAQATAAAPVQTVAGKTGNVVLSKADVALDQADNTADIDKRISTPAQTALDLKAPLAGPVFTGPVLVPNVAPGNNTGLAANTAFVISTVAQAVADLVGTAPEVLNVLGEFAMAIANDPNFAATQAAALGNRLRVDVATQGLTVAQKANAVANLNLARVAVTGAKADVGLGQVEDKTSATIRGELTKLNVTDALAYTPANRAGDTLDSMVVTNSTLDSTPIGALAPAAAAFTTVAAGGQITSAVADGVAPLVVASRTKVVNLNVDLLDGADWASPGAVGETAPNTAKVTALHASQASTTTGLTNTGPLVQAGAVEVTGDVTQQGNSAINGALLVTHDSGFTSTGGVQISAGSTLERPLDGKPRIRFNRDINWYEGFNGQYWFSLGSMPSGNLFNVDYTISGQLTTPITAIATASPPIFPNGVSADYSGIWASTLVIPATNVALTGITFTNLQGITGTLLLTSMPALASASFPGLTTVVGSVAVTSLAGLMSVAAPLLSNIGASLTVANCVALPSINLPGLQRINADLSVSNLAGCTSISAPNLAYVGGGFNLGGLVGAVAVNFGGLVEVVGRINLYEIAALTTVSLTSLEYIGRGLAGGNALTIGPLAASIVSFTLSNSLKCVNGSVYINSSLGQVSVNALLVRLAALNGQGGTTLFANQSVTLAGASAPPSLDGLTAKTALQARGCTVVTN